MEHVKAIREKHTRRCRSRVGNDVAIVVQESGKITIVPNVFHDGKRHPWGDVYELDKDELVYLLTTYSSFVRDKIKEGVTKDDI